MRKSVRFMMIALVLGGFVGTAGLAFAADRTPADILKELEGVTEPKFDPAKRSDQAYVEQVRNEYKKYVAKRGELILELYKIAPDHEKIPTLLAERWGTLPMLSGKPDDTIKEIEETLAHTKNEKLKVEGTFTKTRLKLIQGRTQGAPDVAVIDEFIKLAPKDPRCAQLLNMAANLTRDEKVKSALEDRIVKEFPDSRSAGMILGERRQKGAVGKPFELEFTDAIKGSTVSMKGLKGKVVVIDFWATWCGPCVAEMPRMKEIYAKYKDKGVEFIGVSLDEPKEEGGLDKLKKFVAEEKIAWPQYYQGKGWDSEFSVSWGINSIPCMFVVDTEGNLASVEARQKLETLIPELLKKKSAPVGAGAGAGG